MNQQFKKGIKIIGIACSPFNREKDTLVTVIGAIYRGSLLLEGVLKTKVTVDGEDATDRIAKMIKQSSHYQQLKLIMTRGVTIAGFNYIDQTKLNDLTDLSVISVVDREPDLETIHAALKNLPNGEERYQIIMKNGPPKPMISSSNEEPIYVQYVNMNEEALAQLLKEITIAGRMPEPVRVARLIALAEATNE
ncbi:MAG: DUF99 family protein [Candidatus Heimdallarchaeota archaeon]